jgi:hypothetical protein
MKSASHPLQPPIVQRDTQPLPQPMDLCSIAAWKHAASDLGRAILFGQTMLNNSEEADMPLISCRITRMQ